MNRIVSIKSGKPVSQRRPEQNNVHSFWKRRLAAQVIALLPDDKEAALDVLEDAKFLLTQPIRV